MAVNTGAHTVKFPGKAFQRLTLKEFHQVQAIKPRARRRMKSRPSELEQLLAEQIHLAGLPEPRREYRFAAHHVGKGKGIRERLRAAGLKDWRFDFAWPDHMLAVEAEGGIWMEGRHTRGVGFTEDRRKYAAAQEIGWTVYSTVDSLIRSGEALRTIERLLDNVNNHK